MADVIFPMSRLKHRTWTNHLRRYLDGKIDKVDASFTHTHQDCDLGKWYYSDESKKYKDFPEFKQIEQHHIKFHELVKEVIRLFEAGEKEKAEETFNILAKVSETIVALLIEIEKKSLK